MMAPFVSICMRVSSKLYLSGIEMRCAGGDTAVARASKLYLSGIEIGTSSEEYHSIGALQIVP